MTRSIFKIGSITFSTLPFFCHRRTDRTLRFRGRYFPVCARCTGIYIGTLFVFLLPYFINLAYSLNLFFLSLILVLPTAIDGITQFIKWRESRNWIRLVTGFLCGIGSGLILIYL